MGWSHYPLVGGEQIGAYDQFIQLWYAARERDQMLGSELSPTGLHVWETGTVTSVTDNGDGSTTIAVSGKHWNLSGAGCKNPWLDTTTTTCSTTEPDYAPAGWRAGVGNADPSQAFVGDITGWGTSSLTVSFRVADMVASGQVPDLAFFVGQRVYIFGIGRPFWFEQWPAWPNNTPLETGTIHAATTTTLTVAGQLFTGGKYNGKRIVCRDTAGNLLRLAIAGTVTDATTDPVTSKFTFAIQPHAPAVGAAFAIIRPDSLYLPGQVPCQPFAWYTGYWDGLYSHRPDDVLDVAPYPQLVSAPIEEGASPCTGTLAPVTIYDVNYWTLDTNECTGGANEPLNPDVTKTLRWLQAWGEQVCGNFLPGNGPQGTNHDPSIAFASYVPATWLTALGCDSASSTVSGTSASVDTSGFEYGEGLAVQWAIKAPDGGVVNAGSGTIASGTLGGLPSGKDGYPIVVTPGWTRFFEKQVRAFEEVTYWTPDADPDALLPNSYIIPPREPLGGETAGPGFWTTVPASTHYLLSDQHGRMRDTSNDHYTIASNALVRLAGQQWFDTTTTYAPSADGIPVPAVYQDRAFIGRRRDAVQGRLDALKSGTVDAANVSTRHLIDPGVDWFAGDFFTGGVLIEFTGTDAISGTSVSLTSKTGSAFFTAPTQWMVGQTIEGKTGVDSGGNPIYQPRLVTAQTGVGLTLNETLPACSAWRIQAPDSVLNRWKGQHARFLKLTPIFSDGSRGAVQRTKIDGNGRRSLFFASAITLPAGVVRWAYEIVDPDFGGVWKRAAPANGDPCDWTEVTGGSDAVRRGVTVPADFHQSSRENWPDVLKDYGRMCPGDSPPEVMNAIYRGINLLRYTYNSASWTNKGENNRSTAGTGTYASGGGGDQDTYTLAVLQGYIDANWGSTGSFTATPAAAGSASVSSVSQAPAASVSIGYHYTADPDGTPNPNSLDEFGASATANYAYMLSAEPVAFPGRPSHSTAGFVFAGIDLADDPAGTLACDGFNLAYDSDSTGIAYHTWSGAGGLSSDGAGHEVSGKVGNLARPPWHYAVTTEYQIAFDGGGSPILDGSGCLTYTTTVRGYLATGDAGYYVLNQAAVLTWTATYQA